MCKSGTGGAVAWIRRNYFVALLIVSVITPGISLGSPERVKGDRTALVDADDVIVGAPGGKPQGDQQRSAFLSGVDVEPTRHVPLEYWWNEDFPNGLPLGLGYGLSWGDYDADGYVDLFSCQSGILWRNADGVTWDFSTDLDAVVLPPTERRYGASFGDFNRDGLPDIATEPRVPFWGDDGMHLLKNLGGGEFVDVAGDPAIVDVQPYDNGETLCWGDVDGDGNLDAFVPVYPEIVDGPGNFFLFNLGPTGPGGAYRFAEMSAAAGLDNPADASRPEGAQFVDYDFDGDIDLFSNGTLYRNVSSRGVPRFEVMAGSACGIEYRDSLDEGAMFFDYDLDGDQDLFAVYTDHGVRIWENFGDGSFFAAEQEIVDDPMTGLNLGMSAADWDNDGDIDFTTREVFRLNRFAEDGVRHFEVASHSIPDHHLTGATPSWADWDKDGDIDCALGNYGRIGRFYENTLYSPTAPDTAGRHLRVRIVDDSADVAAGLEVEYGAAAEIHSPQADGAVRRRNFVASSHGYLNQNEYTLHFGLPEELAENEIDLSVDYPGLPADGLWRVDKHVNPALGEIDLAELGEREIRVHRCGGAVVDGVAHDPLPLASPVRTVTSDGLAFPSVGSGLRPPTAAPEPNWFTGVAFDTSTAATRLRIVDVIFDGQLATPVYCGGRASNLALWDVTDPASPFVVEGGSVAASTSSRNRRSYIRTDWVVEPDRSYRLVARVSELRTSAIDAPSQDGAMTVLGGLSYQDSSPCDGSAVVAAMPNLKGTTVALRFGAVPLSADPDPVGDTLRLALESGRHPVLTWLDPSVPGYEVRRCNADAGPCVPGRLAVSDESSYSDSEAFPPPGRLFLYRVVALNECLAELHGLGD